MVRSARVSLPAVLLSLALAAGPAAAQSEPPSPAELDAQVKRVEIALDRIKMEQQSVYQQFQMVQELRRGELQQSVQSSLVYTPEPTPPNYDDRVREREAREARMQRYADELDRLYARYRDLEEQKRPLLDELAQLAAQRR
jgi:hypothetical protein